MHPPSPTPPADGTPPQGIRDLPSLHPSMLRPRRRMRGTAFPFREEAVEYFYLARNAIYALCKHWELAGTEVLVPSYFHGVEIEALLAADVRLRFYPVDRNMQVDAAQVEALVTSKTSAIYLIHYLGFPGPVEALRTACDTHGIKLIEDCALALLSESGTGPLGSLGDGSVFCLYKTLPVPSGGALWLKSGDLGRIPSSTRKAPLRAAWGRVVSSLIEHYELRDNVVARSIWSSVRRIGRSAAQRVEPERIDVGSQDLNLDHIHLGMNRVSRTILRNQDFPAIIQRRRANYELLHEALADLSEPIFTHLPPGVCPLFFPIRVREEKSSIIARLKKRGIHAINLWLEPHPVLPPGRFPAADELRRTVLELPCHQDLDADDVLRIAAVVREEWKG